MLPETDRDGLLQSLQRCNAEGFHLIATQEINITEVKLSEQRTFLARLAFFLITLATLGLLAH
jgi:hypothetical protein